MIQYCDVPLLNPFKFYKNGIVSEGLDGDWFANQVRAFETRRCYCQKWVTGEERPLVINSTIAPISLKVYNSKKAIVKTINWVNTAANVWACTVNLDAIGQDVFYLYFEATLMETSFKWISEPISVKNSWPLTKVFEYTMADSGGRLYNVQDYPFTLGFKPNFRCEMDIMDWDFLADDNSFVDEIHDVKLESAIPYRQGKLYVGTAPGVAPWVVDLLNRIRCCSRVYFNGLQVAFPQGAKWDITRVKGWPLIGAAIDIAEADNLYSTQQSAGSIEPGIITGLVMDTNWFGTAQNIEVIEIEN